MVTKGFYFLGTQVTLKNVYYGHTSESKTEILLVTQ